MTIVPSQQPPDVQQVHLEPYTPTTIQLSSSEGVEGDGDEEMQLITVQQQQKLISFEEVEEDVLPISEAVSDLDNEEETQTETTVTLTPLGRKRSSDDVDLDVDVQDDAVVETPKHRRNVRTRSQSPPKRQKFDLDPSEIRTSTPSDSGAVYGESGGEEDAVSVEVEAESEDSEAEQERLRLAILMSRQRKSAEIPEVREVPEGKEVALDARNPSPEPNHDSKAREKLELETSSPLSQSVVRIQKRRSEELETLAASDTDADDKLSLAASEAAKASPPKRARLSTLPDLDSVAGASAGASVSLGAAVEVGGEGKRGVENSN